MTGQVGLRPWVIEEAPRVEYCEIKKLGYAELNSEKIHEYVNHSLEYAFEAAHEHKTQTDVYISSKLDTEREDGCKAIILQLKKWEIDSECRGGSWHLHKLFWKENNPFLSGVPQSKARKVSEIFSADKKRRFELIEKGQLSDCKIVFKNGEMNGLKSDLILASGFFRKILSGQIGVREQASGIVTLPEQDLTQEIGVILGIIMGKYLDEELVSHLAKMKPDSLIQLAKYAAYFEVPSVIEICIKTLHECLELWQNLQLRDVFNLALLSEEIDHAKLEQQSSHKEIKEVSLKERIEHFFLINSEFHKSFKKNKELIIFSEDMNDYLQLFRISMDYHQNDLAEMVLKQIARMLKTDNVDCVKNFAKNHKNENVFQPMLEEYMKKQVLELRGRSIKRERSHEKLNEIT